MSIKKLPHWVLVDKFPAFYDADSKTTVQQTARIYGKMNELIESYNKFVDLINTEIANYESATDKDIECLKTSLTKIIADYMYKIDTRIVHQDRAIDEMYDKFKNDMATATAELFQEMKDSGELETIIEESVSEFIENLKSSLTAEVTAEVESVMNTVVSNAKNDVIEIVNAAATQIETAVNSGVDDIGNAVDEAIKEIQNTNFNKFDNTNDYFEVSALPFGLSYVLQFDGEPYSNLQEYKMYCYTIEGNGGLVHIANIPVGSTIIKTGVDNYYQVIVIPNNDKGFIYVISRGSDGYDMVRKLYFMPVGVNGAEDLDGNGTVDGFSIEYERLAPDFDFELSNMPEFISEGESFSAKVLNCTEGKTINYMMYNDSTETDYTTYMKRYVTSDDILIERVTGRIIFFNGEV